MNHSHKCLKSILCAGFMVLLFSIPVPSYPQELPSFEELPVQTSLPDPFTIVDSTRVKTREDWYNKRRPELKMLFQHYIYGYLPPKPLIRTEIRKTDKDVFGGRATYREIILWLQLPGGTEYPVHLAPFIPNKRTKPAPVFLALNFSGNHTLMEYDGISIIERSWIPPRYRETY